MYIWRKRATANWLRTHGDDLAGRSRGGLVTIQRPGSAQALLEIACSTRKEAAELQREFGGQIEKLRADWLERLARQTSASPLRIGSRLSVARTRSRARRGAREIVIPAEAAFGTGDHATTAMCLRILERVTRPQATNWSMLDAGTGSGILAIAGSCFGANRIVAIDNDRIACATARRNAAANRVRGIEFRTGDVLKQTFREKFDLITANLFSELLTAAFPVWTNYLAPEGTMVLSGVLRSQERNVLASLRQNGFAVPEVRRRGKWIALRAVFARKNS
jgi:ribosomal protein L11 methyltransferase